MKFTIEPGEQTWISRGTKLRLWTGAAEDGTPVVLAVVGIAAPKNSIDEQNLQAVKGYRAPVDNCGPNGSTVVAADPNGDLTFGWWWT